MKQLFFALLALCLIPAFGACMFLALWTPGYFWLTLGAFVGAAMWASMVYAEGC